MEALVFVDISLVVRWFVYGTNSELATSDTPTAGTYLAKGAVRSTVPPTNRSHVLSGAQVRCFTGAASFNATFPWRAKHQVT